MRPFSLSDAAIFLLAVPTLALPRLAGHGPTLKGHYWPRQNVTHGPHWQVKNFSTLVAFGDSYTDDSRFLYFSTHGGKPPPAGYSNPVNLNASDGARVWTPYVSQYSGAKIYDYAVGGAVCNNTKTPRYANTSTGTFLYPDIAHYEIPAFFADTLKRNRDGSFFMDMNLTDSVFALWIGTNDVGPGAYLTDSQKSGNLNSYIDCVYESFRNMYYYGARNFVLMNLIPLNLAPMYSADRMDDANMWTNATEINGRMAETVATVNALYDFRTPFEVLVAQAFPESQWAVYNVHRLLLDIHNKPSMFLNGTAPPNVTGIIDQCDPMGNCTLARSPDSYMWFNGLQPSQQVHRLIAKNFVDVVHGKSKYATYWSSM